MKISVETHIEGKLFSIGPERAKKAIERAIQKHVEMGATYAQSIAPVQSGKYRASLRGKVAKTGRSGRVKSYGGPNRMPYSAVIERGFPPPRHSFKGYKVLGRTSDEMQSRSQAITQDVIDSLIEELNA